MSDSCIQSCTYDDFRVSLVLLLLGSKKARFHLTTPRGLPVFLLAYRPSPKRPSRSSTYVKNRSSSASSSAKYEEIKELEYRLDRSHACGHLWLALSMDGFVQLRYPRYPIMRIDWRVMPINTASRVCTKLSWKVSRLSTLVCWPLILCSTVHVTQLWRLVTGRVPTQNPERYLQKNYPMITVRWSHAYWLMTDDCKASY